MIKVLIIDSSALMRQLLVEILSSDSQIEVLGTASNASIALKKIEKLSPDILTLDLEVLKLGGAAFVNDLQRFRPVPLVIFSTISNIEADRHIQLLQPGMVEFIHRPKVNLRPVMQSRAKEVVNKVKVASMASVNADKSVLTAPGSEISAETGHAKPGDPAKDIYDNDMVIAIGASTGGTEAIKEIVSKLPATTPGLVITQHIPTAFSQPFSERLNANSAMSVMQAKDGQPILAGHAYLAPGNQHLEVNREGKVLVCRLVDGAPVNRHKPSVEVMFNSVAKYVGSNALAVLLTGMGDDGSDAMDAFKKVGAPTIAQDEASSVVWGMPGEAVKRGYIDDVLPLRDIAERILYYVAKPR